MSKKWGPQAIALILSVALGAGAALLVHREIRETVLSVYVFLMVVIVIGLWVFDVIFTPGHKLARFLFGAIPLAWSIGILIGAQLRWDSWTLSALLSLIGIPVGLIHILGAQPKPIREWAEEQKKLKGGPRSILD
jgi:hypothetical protein